MWTVEARALMLQSIQDKTAPGVVLVLFEGIREIARVDIPEPATRIENGALIFEKAEAIATQRGVPDRIEISSGNILLLELSVPDEIQIEPADIVPGALIQIKALLIQ